MTSFNVFTTEMATTEAREALALPIFGVWGFPTSVVAISVV